MQMRWDGGTVCLHLEQFVTTSQGVLLLPEKISRKNKNSSIVKKDTKCCMCHSSQCSMIATVGVGTSGDKLVHLLNINTDNKEQYTLGLPLTTN